MPAPEAAPHPQGDTFHPAAILADLPPPVTAQEGRGHWLKRLGGKR